MMTTLGQMIDNVAALRAGHVALDWEHDQLGYDDLARLSDQCANALVDAGVKHGDRVAFIGRNSRAFFISLFGAAKMGAVYVNVNWRLAPAELRALIEDAAPSLIIVEPEFQKLFQSAFPDGAEGIRVIGMADRDGPSFDAWLASALPHAKDHGVRADDVVMQMYTSGTTGAPKGVRLSHGAVMFNREAHRQLGPWAKWDETDRLMLCAPGFHISAVAWALVGLAAGTTVVVAKDFIAPDILRMIEDKAITQMMAVPAMMMMFLMCPEVQTTNFTSLRTWHYGASPISPDLLKKSMAVFGCDFVQLYGMTEIAGIITALGPDEHRRDEKLLTSCGKPFDGTEVKIIGDKGQELATGDVGEVLIKTPAVMEGYWGRGADTDAVIRDGWYHSGDAGYRNEDGYVFIVDRVKDMIISGAENIFPVEVEKILISHDGVMDVAVIGVPSSLWGEEVKAIVIANPKAMPSEEELIAFCHQHLAGYKCPKSVDFVKAIPRNASGKILKKDLRAPFWQGVDRAVN